MKLFLWATWLLDRGVTSEQVLWRYRVRTRGIGL